MEIELLDYTSEQLKELLKPDQDHDVAVVQDGMALYFQEVVDSASVQQEVITAEVYDIARYKVEMHLLFPKLWSCTCGDEFICRHQMAVFFSFYSEVGSVMEWVEEWKNSGRPTLPEGLPIKRASEIFAEKQEEAVLEKSYSAYKEFIDRAFSEQIESGLQVPPYIMENRLQQYLNHIGKKEPIEREWKLLYHFTTLLCTFLRTLQLLRLHKKEAYTVRVFYSFATSLTEELVEMVQPLSRQARPFAFDPFVESLKEDIAKLLDGDYMLEFERVDLYREVWTHLFSNASWRRTELERVQVERDALYPETAERNAYTIAMIHLSLLENEDEQAVTQLSELKADAIPYFFYWLNLLADKRPLPFIEFVIAHVGTFLADLDDYYERVDFVRTFTRPISSWCYKSQRLDLLEKFYRVTLPHSYWKYADFLFEQKQYKKWVEMHIYSEISVDMINTELIKEVVSHEPELILPLYYHAVQTKVSLKNRPAYKQAVRYLKKMRTIYKKLKQEETFERYMLYVVDSTKRLRAFQEELKRSKLIDV